MKTIPLIVFLGTLITLGRGQLETWVYPVLPYHAPVPFQHYGGLKPQIFTSCPTVTHTVPEYTTSYVTKEYKARADFNYYGDYFDFATTTTVANCETTPWRRHTIWMSTEITATRTTTKHCQTQGITDHVPASTRYVTRTRTRYFRP